MTIERVYKRFGVITRVDNLDKQIIEASKGMGERAPYIHPGYNFDSGQGDRFQDLGFIKSLDTIEMHHLVLPEHGLIAAPEDTLIKIFNGPEINDVHIHEGSLIDRVVFRWKPTDHEAKRREIEQAIDTNLSHLISNPAVGDASVGTSEDGSQYLLVSTRRELSEEEKAVLEQREKGKLSDRSFYGINIVYQTANGTGENAA